MKIDKKWVLNLAVTINQHNHIRNKWFFNKLSATDLPFLSSQYLNSSQRDRALPGSRLVSLTSVEAEQNTS